MKMIGDVSDWLSYAGGALIKVADSAGSTVSSLRQNQKRANFIDQHDNAPAHTVRLTVNFQVVNIIFVLDRPPLSQDMSAINLLIATLKSKGIAIR